MKRLPIKPDEKQFYFSFMQYKMHIFDEMQFLSHCYTVVSYQAVFRYSIDNKSTLYLFSARIAFFGKTREFGSPTRSREMRQSFTARKE